MQLFAANTCGDAHAGKRRLSGGAGWWERTVGRDGTRGKRPAAGFENERRSGDRTITERTGTIHVFGSLAGKLPAEVERKAFRKNVITADVNAGQNQFKINSRHG